MGPGHGGLQAELRRHFRAPGGQGLATHPCSIALPTQVLAKGSPGAGTVQNCTWLTGTYDPETDLLFWTTGNPCPDYNGSERKGDNLYSDSVLALKPQSGELRWYYQFTPHDLHDWDGAQTAMLVNAPFGGTGRKLLAQASRNGFF
jgi:glucose dehydrogenase